MPAHYGADMSKVAVIAKITALPGLRDEVVAVLSEVVEATTSEPGTLVYAMNVDKADDDVIWFYELYTDEAALGVVDRASEGLDRP